MPERSARARRRKSERSHFPDETSLLCMHSHIDIGTADLNSLPRRFSKSVVTFCAASTTAFISRDHGSDILTTRSTKHDAERIFQAKAVNQYGPKNNTRISLWRVSAAVLSRRGYCYPRARGRRSSQSKSTGRIG